ncbi:MAG: P1 family peptidase [bacterium]
MLTDVPGFKVGHYTDYQAATGCTVILCPPETCGSCEVRGNSPGSRELALLAPEKTMQEVHAVLLTGGSAFGLSAADGVMKWLEDHHIGYPTPWVRVPIVPAAAVFDLNVKSASVRPGAVEAFAACDNATDQFLDEGCIGAGTGTTVGKWNGQQYWMKGGVGSSSFKNESLVIGALAVVNAVGDIINGGGSILAGARNPDGTFLGDTLLHRPLARGKVLKQTNTTLMVTATNARLSKLELYRVAQRMHDGMARAVVPAHTSYDGDISFALSSGTVEVDLDYLCEVASQVTAEAIRRGVRMAKTMFGIPGLHS